jgi:hypothetical protein
MHASWLDMFIITSGDEIQMNYLWLALATAAGAILYCMGGQHGYNTKVRDAGVASIGMVVLYFLCYRSMYIVPHILGVLGSGLVMFGALTWSGKKKGYSAYWWNWALLGLAYGMSTIFYVVTVGLYEEFILRTIFLIITTAVWSDHIENSVWEQSGRGALFIGSMLVFMKG